MARNEPQRSSPAIIIDGPTMPFYLASFRHTFSTGDTVELTSRPYPANSWGHARQLADAFGYEEVRIAVPDQGIDGRVTVYPMLTGVE